MKIILYDGECNLCNKTVQFILKNDAKEIFYFTSLQGTFGQNFLKERNLNAYNFDTFILFDQKVAYYTKSTAGLQVIKEFNWKWKILYYFGIIIPSFIRNYMYKIIAKNRYKWFGKSDLCMLPNPQWKKRFID